MREVLPRCFPMCSVAKPCSSHSASKAPIQVACQGTAPVTGKAAAPVSGKAAAPLTGKAASPVTGKAAARVMQVRDDSIVAASRSLPRVVALALTLTFARTPRAVPAAEKNTAQANPAITEVEDASTTMTTAAPVQVAATA